MADIENLPLRVPAFSAIEFPAKDLPNGFKAAVVDRVIDGDSAWLFIDLDWNGIHDHKNCRLLGIQAPDKQPAKTAATVAASAYMPPGKRIVVYVPDFDKYGRPLVAVFVPELDRTLNQWMMDAGYAVPYDGQTPKPDTLGEP